MAVLFITAVATTWLVILSVYGKSLRRLWHEPVLRVPVLVIESDDWGAGDLAQAAALRKLRETLTSVRDSRGEAAVMTLGLVLAVADRLFMAREGGATYRHMSLTDERFETLVAAVQEGVTAKVFAPQLHGMEHYWPPALMRAAKKDPRVAQWLADETLPTESLPDALQSRWIDASVLPSHALTEHEITQAVDEEARVYRKLFGRSPRVAVPTTFIWTKEVENALACNGVEFLVTPGRRCVGRGASGELIGEPDFLLNGERGEGGITYLVRDIYYEPQRGHRPEQLASRVQHQVDLGRPSLVETHRYNFLSETDDAFDSLQEALRAVLRAQPQLRFMSTEALATALASRDPSIVETRLQRRVSAWVARAYTLPRFLKLARLSGLSLIFAAMRFLFARGLAPA